MTKSILLGKKYKQKPNYEKYVLLLNVCTANEVKEDDFRTESNLWKTFFILQNFG